MKYLLLLAFMASLANATQQTFQFKSPAFSGNGYSNHELTIESLAYNRKVTIQAQAQAAAATAAAAAQNTPINQFIGNLNARIYSQIAAQLTNQIFQTNGPSFGTFNLPGGAYVNWSVDNGSATLSIFDPVANSTSTLTIPISTLLTVPGGG